MVRIFCGVAVVAISFFFLGGSSGTAGKEDDKCCFTNPGYQGVCVVMPGEDETCAGILAYLNNPQSAGKSYCNNTKVRGGWKQVPCDEKSENMQCAVDSP